MLSESLQQSLGDPFGSRSAVSTICRRPAAGRPARLNAQAGVWTPILLTFRCCAPTARSEAVVSENWIASLLQAKEGLTMGQVGFGATSEQQHPNTTENRASSGTRRRSQARGNTTLYGLQNLDPRFKSGRRLQILSSNSTECAPAPQSDASQLDYGGLQIVDGHVVASCKSLCAKSFVDRG
jgi:hypothetical protein